MSRAERLAHAAVVALTLGAMAGCATVSNWTGKGDDAPPRPAYRGTVPQPDEADAQYRRTASAPRDCGAEVAEAQDLHLSLIEEMLGRGLFHAALAHLDALPAKSREVPRARYLRAEALRRGGDLAAAQPVYTGLLDTCLGGLGHFGLGRIAASQCALATAQGELELARASRPVDVRVLNDLGMVYFARGDLPAAQQSFQTAVELTRGEGPATRNLLHVLVAQQRWSEAEQVAGRFAVNLASLEALRDVPAPDLGCAQAAQVQGSNVSGR
jgi:Flp pilus assembly protein TadD